MRSAARSTSVAVVNRPKLSRNEALASWVGTPIARSTGEASAWADVQADPVLTATSGSEAKRALPSTAAKEILLVPGNRFSRDLS